jgi:hypothetical protein
MQNVIWTLLQDCAHNMNKQTKIFFCMPCYKINGYQQSIDSRMTYARSTTKTHLDNTNDDEKWRTTKWQPTITSCQKGILETWFLSFQAIGGIKKLKVEDARYDIRVHQEH